MFTKCLSYKSNLKMIIFLLSVKFFHSSNQITFTHILRCSKEQAIYLITEKEIGKINQEPHQNQREPQNHQSLKEKKETVLV